MNKTFTKISEQFIEKITSDIKGIIKAGNSMTVSDTTLDVNLKSGDGVDFGNGNFQIKVGDGLKLGADGAIEAKIDNSLMFDETGKITINATTGIYINSGKINLQLSDGLYLDDNRDVSAKYNVGLNGEDNKIIAVGGDGIKVDTSGISVDTDDGPIANSDGLTIKTNEGVICDSYGLSINIGSGLGFDSNNRLKTNISYPSVTPGNGIKKTGDVYYAVQGSGVTVDSTGINLNVGSGLSINSSGSIDADVPESKEYTAGGGIVINNNILSVKPDVGFPSATSVDLMSKSWTMGSYPEYNIGSGIDKNFGKYLYYTAPSDGVCVIKMGVGASLPLIPQPSYTSTEVYPIALWIENLTTKYMFCNHTFGVYGETRSTAYASVYAFARSGEKLAISCRYDPISHGISSSEAFNCFSPDYFKFIYYNKF